MAKSQNNVVTHGLSGKIGNLLVFRQRDGKTIVSKMPEQSKTASEKQQKQRKRFQKAVLYAKSVFASPSTEALYAKMTKKGKNPFNVAVADFFNAPDIETVDLSDYTGTPGDEIRIMASDDFAVKSVHVQIINADGSQVEEGEAAHSAGDLWIYTAVQNNENLVGDKIIVTASDLPGNIAEKERMLSEG
jgi:hypothetical protein